MATAATPHPLKYDEASYKKILGIRIEIAPKAQAPELALVASGFEQNLLRSKALFGLPDYIQRQAHHVTDDVLGQLQLPAELLESYQKAIAPFREFLRGDDSRIIAMRVLFDNPTKEESRPAIEAMFAAVMLYTWTAFEVLATDLWVNAVDARPVGLGKPAFRKADSSRRKAAAKLPPLHDPGSKYGTYLYQLNPPAQPFNRWGSLRGFEASYSAAFGPGFASNFTDPELVDLQAIRQVVVHRAGTVDTKFQGRIAKASRWSSLNPADEFPVDAESAVDYLAETVRCGTALLQAVDQWITLNPK